MNQTTENYLKGIYSLSLEAPEVTTNALAEHLNTKPSSVTDMLKKLDERGLIRHTRYQGASLTAKGKRIAIAIVRKHRLWEVFLVEKLHFGWDEVHDIAEQLEHIVSDELTTRLDKFLGYPKFDPHGDPIPDADGQFAERPLIPVSELTPGSKGVIRGVGDHSTSFLRHLDRIGLRPGQRFLLVERFDYDDSCEVQLLPSKVNTHISLTTCSNLLAEIL